MALNLNLDKIATKIKDVESKTSGEVVVVLAKQSDEYRYIPTLWAALIALFVPLIFIISSNLLNVFGFSGVYFLQLVVFLLTVLLLRIEKLKFLLIPKYIQKKRAMRLAREQFLTQELHSTQDRTGVLLFISLSERYVEVIADNGIYLKLDKVIWQNIVDNLINNIKQDKMSTGILSALDEIGSLLQEHFPADAKADKNQLPNHLILID